MKAKMKEKKQQKRASKHGALMAKIHKSQPPKKSSRPQQRHHHPKNLANLQALADALPEFDPDLQGPDSSGNVIRQKTLRHKPGAQKRRQKLEKVERDRFASNMAQMAGMPRAEQTDQTGQTEQTEQTGQTGQTSQTDHQSDGTATRWAALRSFISQTMEHQPGL